MELGQPHNVEAPALGGVDLRKGFLKGLPLAAAGKSRKLVEHAEFHDALLLSSRGAANRMPTGSRIARRGVVPLSWPHAIRGREAGNEAILRRRRGDPGGVSQSGSRL